MDIHVNEAVRYLAAQSGQIAVLIAAVAVVTFALRRHSAHVRYLLWLIVLAKCLVPPLQVIPLQILPQPGVKTAGSSQLTGAAEQLPIESPAFLGTPDSQSGESLQRAQPLPTNERRLSVPGWLGVLWIAGAGAYLAMNLLRAVRGHYRLRRSRLALPDDVRAEAESLLRPYGTRRLPAIWMVEKIGQPFVWGLVRGSIYVPPGFLAIESPEHRRNILAHELSHVLRFDAGVNTLQVFAQGLFWFHPLVWWASRRIRQEREKCCDEMVIARMGAQPRSYSRAIVEALFVAREARTLVPSLAIAGPARNIEERIKTLLQPGRRFHQRPSLGTIACALLLALLVVPTTLALTSRPADATQRQTKETDTENNNDQAQARRLLSAERLRQIGLSLDAYARDHGGQYPEQVTALTPYFGERTDELATFLSNDVEYLTGGKARPETGVSDIPLAYDLTLLRRSEGTNVVFADGHVAFVSGAPLDKYGIKLPESHLEILEIRFEAIHQGKNVVHVTVKNTSDQEQVFATHIYTRSPNYGEGGVGWGTPSFDTVKPQENKPVRFVFKIQGPITDRTYVILRLYNPSTQESYDYKRYFEQRRYTSAELPKQPPQVGHEPASAAEAQDVTQAFRQIQDDIRNRQYEQAWERFSKDYQNAEYQTRFEWFRRAMEPTHPMHSAFTWERQDFLALQPRQVFQTNNVLLLMAVTNGQTWIIDFVRDDDRWRLDWIAGYVPAILRPQAENQPASAPGGSNATIPGQAPASADKAGNLEVRNIRFDPIRQGKNVLHVEVRNLSQTDQTFGLDIRTEFPFQNWQKQLFQPVQGGATKAMTFDFEILGPVAEGSSVRLRFYNPPSAAAFDIQSWFQERRYTLDELPVQEGARGPTGPVPQAEKDAVTKVFEQFQRSLQEQDYPAAWNLASEHFRSLFQNDIGRFRGEVGSDQARKMFAALRPESVTRLGTFLTLHAPGDSYTMKLHFIQENGQWRIYQGQMDRGNWETRLLPTLAQRSTEHFDIYYFQDSTAAKEIDEIARRKEEGFRRICQFLGQDSKTRIRIVLFEDGRTKQQETGHQGAGWAYGNTIVEVYNEKERLDPYHETTHILMGPIGSPPALFNEGFATYLCERLGTQALESLSGGKATLYQRARELKNKGEWIDLRELLGYTEIGSAKSRPPIAYPEAASFVKFLIDTYGKDPFLQAYKTLRNSNEEGVRAESIKKLEEIYGKSLQTLQQQWEAALARS